MKDKPMTQLNFRQILAQELIGNYTCRKRQTSQINVTKANKANGRIVNSNIIMNDVGKHFPVKGNCNRCAYCVPKKMLNVQVLNVLNVKFHYVLNVSCLFISSRLL